MSDDTHDKSPEVQGTGKLVSSESIAAPGIARRGFILAAGAAGLSLTALGFIGREEARAATFKPDLTMDPNPNPTFGYPKWFPSWDEIERLAKALDVEPEDLWPSTAR